MSKLNTTWIQIPNETIKNEKFKINDKSFTVYAYLLYVKFKSYSEAAFEVDHVKMKKLLNFKDNRTFKKCFDDLYENKLIITKVEKFPINSGLKIEISNIKEKRFTQLPVSLLYKINKINYTGFRLLFYYESFILRKPGKINYAFPNYSELQKELNMSSKTISKYNKILEEENLITIYKHLAEQDEYSEITTFKQFSNRYKINLNTMIKKEGRKGGKKDEN